MQATRPLPVVQELIKAGAAVDQAKNDGVTPLYIGCGYGHDNFSGYTFRQLQESNVVDMCADGFGEYFKS
jgi:hypothetical protein